MNMKRLLLDKIKEDYEACLLCPIGHWAKHHVLGKGHLQPEVLFIGEGPGKLEDVLGSPFVGLAGQLLDQALRRAGGGEGSNDEPFPFRAYFSNLVACRPCDRLGGNNRAPTDDEVDNCSDRLKRTILALAPRIIVLLGRIPKDALLQDPYIKKFQVFCIEHPAYILRQGGVKSLAFKNYILKIKEIVNACKKASKQ